MRTRTKARLRAVEALFEAEQRQVDANEVIARNPETNEFANALVADVSANLEAIDETLNTYTTGWPTNRMPAVDRAILRAAVAELVLHQDTDTAIIISEATEVADTLSTDESVKFIHGVLSTISKVRETLAF